MGSIDRIFISHSSTDRNLIKQVDEALNIINAEGCIYEFQHISEHLDDQDAIVKEIKQCQVCFVFPTTSVIEKGITKSWVIAESAIARANEIPTLIFKDREDNIFSRVSPNIRFPYFDGLIEYEKIGFSAKIQKILQKLQTQTNFELEPNIQCNNSKCNIKFFYKGKRERFNCPHCLSLIRKGESKINKN